MAKENAVPDLGWDQLFKEFIALVVKTPLALVSLVFSFLLGYGISFVLFDYRRSTVSKSHYFYHLVIGIGYATSIFLLVNRDLISADITADKIAGRMPLTLIVSLSVGFVIILCGSIYREIKVPYNNRGDQNG